MDALLDGERARVSLGGACTEISLALVEGVVVGDYVIVHVGFALSRIDPDEARATLELFGQLADAAPEDSP